MPGGPRSQVNIAVCDDDPPDRRQIAELTGALRKQGDGTAIIFISSNREMAMRGYEVAASRYLSKPVQRPRLREALLFCQSASTGWTSCAGRWWTI